MAIVTVAEIEGGDQDFYEAVSARVMPGGELPEGARVHIAGPIENGWRVITVWESQEDFERTRDERLGPAIAEHGAGMTPKITVSEVHRLLTR